MRVEAMTDEIMEALLDDGRIEESSPLIRGTVKKALEDHWDGKIAHVWSIGDIASVAEQMDIELTEDEMREILATVDRRAEADVGINWSVLETHVQMFESNRDREAADVPE